MVASWGLLKRYNYWSKQKLMSNVLEKLSFDVCLEMVCWQRPLMKANKTFQLDDQELSRLRNAPVMQK